MRKQNENKKTILMVHNFYQIGGGEHTVFHNEVEMLRNNNHKVVEYTRSNEELKYSTVKKLLLPFTTIWSFKTYRETKEIIKREKIDIVHCHNTFPLISPSVYYAARSMKVPVVQTIHNFRFLCPNGIFYCNGHICEECVNKNSFIPALKNKCYRGSLIETLVVSNMLFVHRIFGTYKKISYIFLTDFNLKKFNAVIKTNQEQTFVKPNFVISTNRINNKHIKHQFIFVGRLEEEKGIGFLLKEWGKIKGNYHLIIFGEGPYRNAVIKMSEYNPTIEYRGFQSQEVVHKEIAQSVALLFCSSWFEGFPMTIAESFSVSTPVLSSNIGNQANIICASGGGITFDFNNSESFVKGINNIIRNREKYSSNAKKYYGKYLTEKANYSFLSDVYEKVKCI